MRSALALTFLAGMFLCAGCFTTAPPMATPPAPKMTDAVKAPPPVTPESVNDENYRASLQALDDELARDEQRIIFNKMRQ